MVARQSLEIRGGFPHFEECGTLAGSRHDEVSLNPLLYAQLLQETPAVDGATGSGDSNDNPQVTFPG